MSQSPCTEVQSQMGKWTLDTDSSPWAPKRSEEGPASSLILTSLLQDQGSHTAQSLSTNTVESGC